jgi:hypothetical protein
LFFAKIHVANATVGNDGDAQAEEHKFADGCSCGTKAGCIRISFNREQ